jgi:uncharacterized membrane protein
VLAILGVSWLATIVLTPLLPSAAAALVYIAGSLVCHQRPERSFHLAGAQLPVCARCAGVYAGAALGARGSLRRPALPVARPRSAMLAAALPVAATLAVEWAGLADPGNWMRALSGVVAGAGVAVVVLTLHYDECARTRRNEPSPPPTPI